MRSMTSSNSAVNSVGLAMLTAVDRWTAIEDSNNGLACIRAPSEEPLILFLALRVRMDFAISFLQFDEPAANNQR